MCPTTLLCVGISLRLSSAAPRLELHEVYEYEYECLELQYSRLKLPAELLLPAAPPPPSPQDEAPKQVRFYVSSIISIVHLNSNCHYGQSVWGSMGSDRFPNVIYASITPSSVSKQDSKETLPDPDKGVAEDSSSCELDEESRKPYIPNDNEEFIDPRLSDYPIPLVAKAVDLHNDET